MTALDERQAKFTGPNTSTGPGGIMNEPKSDLAEWMTIDEFAKRYKQFSLAQLRHLIWKREEHPGLVTCYRIVGKKGYINSRLFAKWMRGDLTTDK